MILSSPDIKVPKLIAEKQTIGFLFNPRAWWIGAHYSNEYKCLCINVIPFCTVWIVQPGGKIPRSAR